MYDVLDIYCFCVLGYKFKPLNPREYARTRGGPSSTVDCQRRLLVRLQKVQICDRVGHVDVFISDPTFNTSFVATVFCNREVSALAGVNSALFCISFSDVSTLA